MVRWLSVTMFCGCTGGLQPYNDNTRDTSPVVPETYRMVTLAVIDAADVSGDGVTDNQLKVAIDAVDLLMADDFMSLPAFNERLDEVLAMPQNVLLLDLAHGDGALSMQMSAAVQRDDGFEIDPASVVAFDGWIEPGLSFEGGPADLSFSLIAQLGFEPVDVPLRSARIDGQLDARIEGEIVGVIPIDVVLEEVVDPLLIAWDLDGDGVPEPEEEIRGLVHGLAPGLADVVLDDGTLGMSAWLSYSAERVGS